MGAGLREIIFSRNPGDWVDDQLADIEKAARRGRRSRDVGRGGELPPPHPLEGDGRCADQVARGREVVRSWSSA